VSCCSPPPGCELFDERLARRDARRYRKRGLDPDARRLLDALEPAGAEVLEVGGGVGALQVALARAGAQRVVGVELSPAYEHEAARLFHEARVADRVERRIFDFAQASDDAAPADIVVMHKVVCCYPDMEALVRTGADKARRTLAMTFPRAAWWNRLGVKLINAAMWALRRQFRTFVHDPRAIVGVAGARGLQPVFEHRGAIWQVTMLERAG